MDLHLRFPTKAFGRLAFTGWGARTARRNGSTLFYGGWTAITLLPENIDAGYRGLYTASRKELLLTTGLDQ